MTTQTVGKEKTLLTARDSHNTELYISVWDGVYLLDCSSDYRGFKSFTDLPRIGKSVRGCKLIAASITCEKLNWSPV